MITVPIPTPEYLSISGLILLLFIVGYCLGGLVWLIEFSIRDGNIFGFYGRWLEANEHRPFTKLIGGCPYCYGFWLSMIAFWLVIYFVKPEIHLLPLVLMSWLFGGYVFERIKDLDD